jgi:hypothetical protein
MYIGMKNTLKVTAITLPNELVFFILFLDFFIYYIKNKFTKIKKYYFNIFLNKKIF